MTAIDRRTFVRKTSLGALAFPVTGGVAWLTPREASAKAVPLRVLSREEAIVLAAFCDHLLPGAANAGVVHFIDHQLGETPNNCLLMCKFFPGINAPYAAFYRDGLDALTKLSAHHYAKMFQDLDVAEKDTLIRALWEGQADPWAGPPPPLFYMSVRSDAVDVVYGTEKGFDDLAIPYLAHIRPPANWSGDKA